MLAFIFSTCAAALAPLVTVRSLSISHQYLRPRASVAIGCTRDRPAAQQPPWRTCVPNYLTLSRIAGVPVLAAAFYSPRAAAARAPALIFGIISFTDFLDGYLARRWQVESALGAFLDPIADKFVVCATLVLLSGSLGTVVAAPTALIVCRELGISALRECVGRPSSRMPQGHAFRQPDGPLPCDPVRRRMAELGARDLVPVGWWGKVKTATQLLSLTLMLLSGAPVPARPGTDMALQRVGLVLLYAAAALTASSAVPYLRAAWPVLTRGGRLAEEEKPSASDASVVRS